MPSKFKLPEGLDFTFETERLLIRPLQEQDRAFYISLYTDEKIMKLIAPPFSEEQANKAFEMTRKAMVQSMEQLVPTTMTWVICEKDTNSPIGIQSADFRKKTLLVNQQPADTKSSESEFGIILSRQGQGKQLPQEAIIGLSKFCLAQLRVSKVFCTFDRKNIAVSNFIKKVGFVKPLNIVTTEPNKEYQQLPENWLSEHLYC